MDLMGVANELVAGCREGRERENLDKLYAADAVSIEAMCMPGTESRETHGLDGIKGKHDWWDQTNEITSSTVSGPFLHGDDRFAVYFNAQGRAKDSGESFEMEEVAVYHVSGGKIVREEFFYTVG